MEIASNSPWSFTPRENFSFHQLGEKIEKTSKIILLLEKNWGSNSIAKIESILFWLRKYPRKIPCFLVGCEVTIPDTADSQELPRFRDNKRDKLIYDLCLEVLERSSTIGVRRRVTYSFLSDVLGIPKDKLEIIYDKEKVVLESFIENNDSTLSEFKGDFEHFQKRPKVLYELPKSSSKDILIKSPFLTNNGNRARLNCEIVIDGKSSTLWCETQKTYKKYLLKERADAFLSILLPFAMRAKKDIICEAPITDDFLYNLTEILIPHLCEYDQRLHRTEIVANSTNSRLRCGGAVATGMSGGVDSFYSAIHLQSSRCKSMRLSHIYCGNYLYGNQSSVFSRAEKIAKDMGLAYVSTTNNLGDILTLPHLQTHFYKIMFGVLSLKKLFKHYFYSSAEDLGVFKLVNNASNDTIYSELLLLYSFSTKEMSLHSGGGKAHRLEKTKYIAGNETAQKYLNVCLFPEKSINCGICEKCQRTLLMLDMLGYLDEFNESFDILKYKKNRKRHFEYLVRQKKSYNLKRVYDFFKKEEPTLISEAEANVKGKHA